MELNKSKPKNISVIGIGKAPDDPEFNVNNSNRVADKGKPYQDSFNFDWEAVEGAIYGKIVQIVGERR